MSSRPISNTESKSNTLKRDINKVSGKWVSWEVSFHYEFMNHFHSLGLRVVQYQVTFLFQPLLASTSMRNGATQTSERAQ